MFSLFTYRTCSTYVNIGQSAKMPKLSILLTFINGLVFTVAKEPSCPVCSSFDYEHKLLERVLRNELALENLIKEIKETNVKVTGVLADVDEKRTTLNSALEKAKHDIQNIVQDYRQINKSISSLPEQSNAVPMVYFRARTPTTNTPPIGQHVVFTQVEANEGLGYDKATGKFTAPVTGLYMFSVQFCAEGNKWAFLSIIQDDKLLEAFGHQGSSFSECATFQVFTAVAKGNKVWVKVTSSTDLYDQYGHRHNSFSGVLIRS